MKIILLALALALPASATAGTVKTAFNAKLKKTILVDARGRTLYLFAEDKGMSTPTCYGNLLPGCGKEWPALLAPAQAGPGVAASLLGTEKRPDGSLQVTYHGWPLYYFAGSKNDGAGDKKPGDLRGLGLYDLWWAVSPKGAPVKK